MKYKKVMTLLAVVFLSFSLSACSGGENDVSLENNTSMNEETEEEKEESESTEEETETTKETESEEEEEITKEIESEEETETTNENESQKEIKTEESKEETKTVETSTPIETPKQEEVHTHNYNGVVTTQSTCIASGVKTYTCSCGDSYTESLGTTAHDYSVVEYQTIHHDEEWSSVPKTITVKTIQCGCGQRFSSNEEYQSHAVASVEAGDFRCGMVSAVDETQETVYDNVMISEAWDETITIYKCSMCGQQQ